MRQLLGSNRGLELGNVTQFSTQKESIYSDSTFAAVTAQKFEGAYSGRVLVLWAVPAGLGRTAWMRVRSQAVAVYPGRPYTCNVRSKFGAQGVHYDSHSYRFSAIFYNADGTQISEVNLVTAWPTSAWRLDSGVVVAPANAATMRIAVYQSVTYYNPNAEDSRQITNTCYYDNFSILVPSGGGYWIY